MEKQKYTILVLDDDYTIVEMIHDGLVMENFEVVTATHPKEALNNLNDVALDYALLDLDLGWGNMTGIEVGQELRKRYPDLVVIIMTGYNNLKFAVQAMREHGFHYMIKPFRIDQIISLTERAQRELALKKENQALKEEIKSLKDEIERLKDLIKQIRPEEAGLTYSSKARRLRDADALTSYQKQKKS